MKPCFLDLDGVLLDFVRGAFEWFGHGDEYSEEPDKFPLSLGEWGTMPCPHWNMTPGEFWDGLTHEFWATLKWIKGGREIFEHLLVVYDKDLYFLSSPLGGPQSASGKMEWVKRELPFMERRTILTASKHVLAPSGGILVDDSDSNIDSYDGPKILVPRLWNSAYRDRGNTMVLLGRATLDHRYGRA